MMAQFREKTPARSDISVNHYKDAFAEIRDDFSSRCGYCDTSDKYLTINFFEIDHFKPKSKFEDLTHEYSNLVYSCKNCNMFKSSYWPTDSPSEMISSSGDEGLVDPCSERYTFMYERREDGQIMPTDDEISKFMYRRLKLYLQKRTFYNQMDRIDEKINAIKSHSNKTMITADEMCHLMDMKEELQTLVNRVELSYKIK